MSAPRSSIPVPQRMAVGCALAFVGGFMDIYTYLLRGGAFATAQTGNVVLLAVRLTEGDWAGALRYLTPIAAYLLGILMTALLRRRMRPIDNLHWRQVVIFTELTMMAAIGFIPLSAPPLLINTMIALVCSVQVASFDMLEGRPYASTMCTGNLRHLMEHVVHATVDKAAHSRRAAFRYACILAFFMLGAVAGSWLSHTMRERSIWVCCYVLIYVLCYLLVERDEEDEISRPK